MGAAALRRVEADRPLELPTVASWMVLAGRIAASVALLIGVAVLLGYALESEAIVRVAPSLPPMYPNAAIAFAAGGGAALVLGGLGRWRRVGALALAGLVVAIGGVGLVLHLLDSPAGWYEALWPDPPFVAATTPIGGRPAPETCVALVLVGAALVLHATDRAPGWAQALSLASVTIGLTAFIGFVVGVDRARLGGSLVVVGMALHTSVAVTSLGVAALLARPGVGVLRLVTDAGPGGRLGRRLLLVALIAPLMLATMAAVVSDALDESELALSLLAVMQVAVLGGLILVPVAIIERSEWRAVVATQADRRRAEASGDSDLALGVVASELLMEPAQVPGWDVSVCQEPAEGMVAGDSQQVLTRDGGDLLVAVVDVSGHGTIAGMHALRLRAEIAALWPNRVPLDEIMFTLNHTVVERASLASVVLFEVSSATGEGRYVNAGHPAPIQVNGRQLVDWSCTGPVLGLAGRGHGQRAVNIEPGEVVVFYTDGVTEARDAQGEQLGEERLRRLIRRRAPEGPAEISRACVDAAFEHARQMLDDDVMVVTVQRR